MTNLHSERAALSCTRTKCVRSNVRLIARAIRVSNTVSFGTPRDSRVMISRGLNNEPHIAKYHLTEE